MQTLRISLFTAFTLLATALCAIAQTGPSTTEKAAYRGLHAAAVNGDIAAIRKAKGNARLLNARDGHGRTPLMVAAFARKLDAAQALIDAGADIDALEFDRYDALTIAAVDDNPAMVKLLIAKGANTGLVTSRYDGTALIAAAHLGHVEVVKVLIAGKAPLDHVNNLKWTALIEAIVLGDGGTRHVEVLRALVEAGADVNLADGNGVRPLSLAMKRSYTDMVKILRSAGAKP